MSKPMTRQEWLSYLEQTWDAAQKEAWSEQPRQWVGLTEGEINDLSREMVKGGKSVNWLSSRIEAKLREKNT